MIQRFAFPVAVVGVVITSKSAAAEQAPQQQQQPIATTSANPTEPSLQIFELRQQLLPLAVQAADMHIAAFEQDFQFLHIRCGQHPAFAEALRQWSIHIDGRVGSGELRRRTLGGVEIQRNRAPRQSAFVLWQGNA